MTKKMIIALEDELIKELSKTAKALDKKKTQIVHEEYRAF